MATILWVLLGIIIGTVGTYLAMSRAYPALEAATETTMLDLLGENARLAHDNRALRAAAQMAVTGGEEGVVA